ncbi:uncharacterized protein METZ01_LOCUS247822 [marine metagenome]|uniref:Uncharacterized protein n=1 Tax=marine metagenome TaxID=408172 RepID=A0A382I5Z5_9ZZZZ
MFGYGQTAACRSQKVTCGPFADTDDSTHYLQAGTPTLVNQNSMALEYSVKRN